MKRVNEIMDEALQREREMRKGTVVNLSHERSLGNLLYTAESRMGPREDETKYKPSEPVNNMFEEYEEINDAVLRIIEGEGHPSPAKAVKGKLYLVKN